MLEARPEAMICIVTETGVIGNQCIIEGVKEEAGTSK